MANVFDTAETRAGVLLMKKDEDERRHSLKKTEEEIFEDFEFDLHHPFMPFISKVAEEYARTGKPFVLHKRIANLTDDNKSEGFQLYYNEGDMWRQSGNALITKWLKDKYPDLEIPKMHYWTKGTQLLLDKYPDRFAYIREALKDRLEEAVRKEVG